jgi:hypothetical protein
MCWRMDGEMFKRIRNYWLSKCVNPINHRSKEKISKFATQIKDHLVGDYKNVIFIKHKS